MWTRNEWKPSRTLEFGLHSTFDPTSTDPPLALFHGLHRNRKEVVLGDDNSLSLTFNARNEGEGGAYEAELLVVVPPEADYSGIARNNEVTGASGRPEQPQRSQRKSGSWSETSGVSRFSESEPADLQLRAGEPDPHALL